MKHLRRDYDPIQDPRPDGIGEKEPVFLLRATDQCAPETIRVWADLAALADADPDMVDEVLRWADYMEEWQEANGHKVPDVPEGALRRRPTE